MNRQLRRAQAKQDKKQDKEKLRRRSQRHARLQRLRARRPNRPAKTPGQVAKADGAKPAAAAPGSARGSRHPGRFSGFLAGATFFFIVLQSVAPAERQGIGDSLIGAAFYLMLGYFVTLWLLRRGTDRAVLISVASGALLAAGTALGALIRPEVPLDGLQLALVAPALVLGSLLGRWVHHKAPA